MHVSTFPELTDLSSRAAAFVFANEGALLLVGLLYLLYGAAEGVILVLEPREGIVSRPPTRVARMVIILTILTIGALHCAEFSYASPGPHSSAPP